MALIGSILTALQDLAGPVASMITNQYGCRTTTIIGGLITSFGIIGSAYLTNFFFVSLLLGVVTGFGSSLVLVASVVVVTYYFEEKPSFAAGLTISGASFGQSIFTMVIIQLHEIYGRSGCLLILGAMVLNCVVCGALYRPLPWELEESEEDEESSSSSSSDDDDDDEEESSDDNNEESSDDDPSSSAPLLPPSGETINPAEAAKQKLQNDKLLVPLNQHHAPLAISNTTVDKNLNSSRDDLNLNKNEMDSNLEIVNPMRKSCAFSEENIFHIVDPEFYYNDITPIHRANKRYRVSSLRQSLGLSSNIPPTSTQSLNELNTIDHDELMEKYNEYNNNNNDNSNTNLIKINSKDDINSVDGRCEDDFYVVEAADLCSDEDDDLTNDNASINSKTKLNKLKKSSDDFEFDREADGEEEEEDNDDEDGADGIVTGVTNDGIIYRTMPRSRSLLKSNNGDDDDDDQVFESRSSKLDLSRLNLSAILPPEDNNNNNIDNDNQVIQDDIDNNEEILGNLNQLNY
jgi:hypothetical protein